MLKTLRSLFAFSGVSDESLIPHYKRAERDFANISFDSDEAKDEAISCKAIYYASPLLWSFIQNRVSEYGDTFIDYRSLEKFQEYWLKRSESLINKSQTSRASSLMFEAV